MRFLRARLLLTWMSSLLLIT